MTRRRDLPETKYRGYAWFAGDDGAPRYHLLIDENNQLVFPSGSPSFPSTEEYDAYKLQVDAAIASLNGVIGSLAGAAAAVLSVSIKDYTYAVLSADGGILAYHRPGEPLVIDVTDPEQIDNVRRLVDSTYVAEVQHGNNESIVTGNGGKIIKARLSGGRELPLGVNGGLGAPYVASARPLDVKWYMGSNDLAIPSLIFPRSPFVINNSMLGQSYTLGTAGAEGDPTDTETYIPPFSTPPRDPGYATQSMATGNTFFRSQTTELPFGSPGIRDLEGLEYFPPGNTRRSISEGMAPEYANQLLAAQQAAMGFKTRQHFIASGRGGYGINWLKPGCPQYKAVLRQHAIDREYQIAQGLIPIPGPILWMQGEEDYNTAWEHLVPAYDSSFRQLWSDICAVYGMVLPMKVLMYAPMRGPAGVNTSKLTCQSAVAYFELMRKYPAEYCVIGAAYMWEHGTDHHPTGKGFRQGGATFARAALAHVYGHGPFFPTCVLDYGDIIKVSSTEWLLPVYTKGRPLVRQAYDVGPIGNPSNTVASTYIGPTPDSGANTACDGGIYCVDAFGVQIGVIQAACGVDIPVSSANYSAGRRPLYIKLASAPTRGAFLQIAARSQSGSVGGTQADGPRTTFYVTGSELTIPTVYPDSTPEAFSDRLCPQRVVLPT